MARTARLATLCGLAFVVMLTMAGCAGGAKTPSAGSAEPSATPGAHMSGIPTDVHISPALAVAPTTLDLKTPESAVRSYLDWTSFSYRTAQSIVSTATMSAEEQVRVDAYIQFNLEKKQIIDQKLKTITFAAPVVESTATLVPAKELWTYRYVSISTGNKVLGGPYSASYDSTYTVVKAKNGTWVVASVLAKPLGKVK